MIIFQVNWYWKEWKTFCFFWPKLLWKKKCHKCVICNNIKQRKAANSHIWETGTRQCLMLNQLSAFLSINHLSMDWSMNPLISNKNNLVSTKPDHTLLYKEDQRLIPHLVHDATLEVGDMVKISSNSVCNSILWCRYISQSLSLLFPTLRCAAPINYCEANIDVIDQTDPDASHLVINVWQFKQSLHSRNTVHGCCCVTRHCWLPLKLTNCNIISYQIVIIPADTGGDAVYFLNKNAAGNLVSWYIWHWNHL